MISMKTKTKHQKSGPGSLLTLLCIVFIAILAIPAIVSADNYVGGIPLTTIQTGTVTGDLYIDATPAPNWGDKIVTKTFALPAAATGSNVKWARLYVSAYSGHMQDDKAFTITNKFDGNGDGTYETTWPETGHAAFTYVGEGNCNDNSALGGTACDPYKMINDHENRVTSDYFMWYDVTSMISSQTVNVYVDTTGSYDGRIKVITLVVAYDDPASTTQTTYWVNQGHDVTSYYTEDNLGEAAVGTTTFGTTGLSGITSATLTADYMASNNGNYGFPTAANDFVALGSAFSPPVTGTFTNLALDNVPDVQGTYSGVDSWDVTSSVTGASDVTLGYSRYFPGTGTAAFYKIPLAVLVVKKPLPVTAPVAGFAADVVSGTVPLTVTFTDQSTNTPTSWAWTFGDSATSTDRNPVHQYTTAGTYTVTLTATNAGGSDDETKTGYITVTAAALPNLTFTGANGAATVNPYPAYVFAREANNVQVKTIKNTGTAAVTNIVVALYASDVSSTVPVATATIASLAAGATAPTQTITDPTIRDNAGSSVTYTAVLDPDNLIAETNEADNTRTSTAKTVLNNGYKGKGIYWAGGSNMTTKMTYDLNGDIVYYTQPDSAYQGVGWTGRTETWTAANLPVPAGATVEKALLFFSYNWDQTSGGYPNLVTTFNGNAISLGTPYRDWSNFGAYADYEYGLYPAYDVTSMFSVNSDNTLVTTPGNSGADNLVALYPSTLVIIYRDASDTRKQIFINEEFDYLGVSAASYATTPAEATAYAPFTGMTIDTANVQSATLHSFATNAGPAEGNVFFNGATIATNAFTGTTFSSFAVPFDVKSHLTATGNEAGIQGTESGGMGAIQQILVVEYAASKPNLVVTAISPNVGTGAAMFANEPNVLSVTIQNTGAGDAAASTVSVTDGSSTATAAVSALAAGASETVTVTDTALNTAGTISVTATADTTGAIAESSETDNSLTIPLVVYNNGYKGKRFTGGSDINTQAAFNGKYDVIYSAGDSAYKSAKWLTATDTWTSTDLPIPTGASVVSARLYQPYSYNKMAADPSFTAVFNSNTVTPVATYKDVKGFGTYSYPYGLYVYDVTSQFSTAGNTLVLTPEGTAGTTNDYALYGAYFVVTYSDPATTEKQIFINDEFDMVQSQTQYSVTTDEATAYATFAGIDSSDVDTAKVIAVLASAGDSGKSRFFFNSNEFTGFWADYLTSPQIGFSTYDVKAALASGANEARLQSVDSGSKGDNMYAMNTILVITKNTEPTLSFVPASQSFNPAETRTYDIVMNKAPNGLAGYDMVVSLSNAAPADIVSVTYPDWAGMTLAPVYPSDSVRIGAVDTQQKIYPGTTGPYTLATLTVRGNAAGSTAIQISSVNMDDDSGAVITSTLTPGTAIIGSYTGPTAGFTGTPVDGDAPLTVVFDSSTSTGDITTYQWDFDNDGTIDSTAANPSHIYTGIGTYSVKLVVSGPAGSNTMLMENYIAVTDGTAPTAAIVTNPSPATGNYPLTVAFSASTTGDVSSYAWNFGDGTLSTLAAPTHTYTYPADFTATLVVTGTGGSSAPATVTIHATQNAPVAGIIANPTTGTSPLTVRFTDASTGSFNSYDWDFGDGSPHDTTANPSHEFTSAGVYTVSHTVNGAAGISNTATTTITVTGLSINFAADYTAGVASAEHGFAVQFTSTPNPGATSYLWDFGDGSTSTDANPSHTYYGRHNAFTVTLTVHNGSDVASVTKTNFIHTTPYLEAFPKYDSLGQITTYYSQIPADLNGDYVYEDINHNGRVDYDDVVAFYGAYTYGWIASNTDVDQINFDYSGNGALGYQDVVALNDLVLY